MRSHWFSLSEWGTVTSPEGSGDVVRGLLGGCLRSGGFLSFVACLRGSCN